MFLSIFPLQECSFFILSFTVGKLQTHTIFNALTHITFHLKFNLFDLNCLLSAERAVTAVVKLLVGLVHSGFEVSKFNFVNFSVVWVVKLLPSATLKVDNGFFLLVGSADNVFLLDGRHGVFFFGLHWRWALFDVLNFLLGHTALLPEDKVDGQSDASHDSERNNHHSDCVAWLRLFRSSYVTNFLCVSSLKFSVGL
jgi:hypothetical protein